MKLEYVALDAFFPASIPINIVWSVEAVPRDTALVPSHVSVPRDEVDPINDETVLQLKLLPFVVRYF